MGIALHDPQTIQKVEALLAQMTLDQKIGQMTQAERMSCTPEDVKNYHLGSVLSGAGSSPGANRPADWVEMNDAYWAASMDADDGHLPIPLLYGVDAIHGNNNTLGATVFPHNIGLGATWDPNLLQRIAEVSAREILATGVDWTFAPSLTVARDNRWGRTYESYSEEPALVASCAGPFVRGLQGELGEKGVLACVKHWVGDGGTEHGIDQGDTVSGLQQLRDVHIAPYYPALEEGALTVMASYSSWNGVKCHRHRFLLTDVLKKEMNFAGFIVSDWDGINYLTDDYYEAVGLGANAGIDMFMVSGDWRNFIEQLRAHVTSGSVPMSRIDDAVRRILAVKYAFGLFDKPRPAQRVWSNHPSFGCAEHREVAREAVRKSLVLLKNEDELLPLNESARILVTGSNAHDIGHQCGGFTLAWQGVSGNDIIEGGTSIWQAISARAPNAVLSEVGGADADSDQHDVAVVVIGERPYAEGMGDIRSGNNVIVQAGSQIDGLVQLLEPYGDTLELANSRPEDLATIVSIAGKGIPVIAILVSGRPLVVNRELAEVTSFIAAWLPGSEGGGVADVLFGDHDFHGKLSFSWPGDMGSADNEGEDGYEPLFPYGYGLTYSH